MFHKVAQLLYQANGEPVYYKNFWGEVVDLRAVKVITNGQFVLKQEYVNATDTPLSVVQILRKLQCGTISASMYQSG